MLLTYNIYSSNTKIKSYSKISLTSSSDIPHILAILLIDSPVAANLNTF